jgi:RNA polymerase sigma factor (sigma-70 family)
MVAEVDKGAVLLSAVQNGDQDAFAKLYDQYSAAIHGVVLRIVGSNDMAEEVLQDAFVKIWRASRSYDATKGRAFTWMVNIARNTAIDLVRTAQYRNNDGIRTLDKHVYRMGSDEERARMDHLGMDKVLGKLKPELREMIDLAYYQGYSQQEIADRTGIALGTVKSRTRAALLQLKEALKELA